MAEVESKMVMIFVVEFCSELSAICSTTTNQSENNKDKLRQLQLEQLDTDLRRMLPLWFSSGIFGKDYTCII